MTPRLPLRDRVTLFLVCPRTGAARVLELKYVGPAHALWHGPGSLAAELCLYLLCVVAAVDGALRCDVTACWLLLVASWRLSDRGKITHLPLYYHLPANQATNNQSTILVTAGRSDGLVCTP